MQSKLKSNYEVIKLMAQIESNTITLIPQINTADTRYKQYTRFAYMVFDVIDCNIDEYITNISIQNRQSSGLNKLGNGLKTTYNIKKEWENKIVALFAYCDSQIHTPYVKISFINKPIVILDIGDSGALATKYEQNSMTRKDIISSVIDRLSKNIKPIIYPIILGQNNESLKQRVKIANTIKHNIGHNRILFLSLHIDSEATQKVSGMRCLYNAREYAKKKEAFIEILKKIAMKQCQIIIMAIKESKLEF